MDSIFRKQNEREFLLLQKAQRSTYTKAKRTLYPGAIISVLGITIFAILTVRFESSLIYSLSSFFAIAAFAINEYLGKKTSSLIGEAAKIQQTIDVRLFQMPDNCHTLVPSEIAEYSALYSEDDLNEFNNWYSDYSDLDFPKQVFYCQKENIRWDRRLREKYADLILKLMFVFPVLLILHAIFFNLTAAQFFAVASWLFPLEQLLVMQWMGLRSNIELLDETGREYTAIETSYNGYSSNEINCKLCGMQSYICEHRKRAILVPDWFYQKHQRRMQAFEDNIAKQSHKAAVKEEPTVH